MTLVKYTPYRRQAQWPAFESLSNRISQVFGEPWDTPEPTGTWFPAVDVEETPDEVTLIAELPGMLEEDVDGVVKQAADRYDYFLGNGPSTGSG